MLEEEPCMTVAQAARRGHIDELKSLISDGHPVDVHDNRGWMAIHEASDGNFIDCLSYLLQQGATDVNYQSFDGKTALHIAAAGGHLICLKALLDHGANPNIIDSWFETSLFSAVRSKNLECVRALLDSRGIEVNRQSFDNSTPLHNAVSSDQCEMVRELLNSGARVDLMQDEDISPVFLASHFGRTECLRLLIEHLKSSGQLSVLNAAAADGASPLFLAAQEGHIECVKLLLDNGANASVPTQSPVALPLHAALQFNHIDCVEVLLKATDLCRLPECSVSPYYFSMMQDDAKATDCLIRAGVNLNAAYECVDDDEYQPKTMEANSSLALLEILDHSSSDELNVEQSVPSWTQFENGDVIPRPPSRKVVKVGHQVLRYFNREVRYGRRFTPLVIIALYEYSIGHARLLLQAGASANACPPCRVPPILPALDMFNLDLVKELIGAGAELDTYHRHVIGNMSVIVCLHYWQGLQLMLKCGAEVESLFSGLVAKSQQLASRVASSSDDDDDEDYGNEVGVLAIPIPFWRLLAEARHVMSRRGVTVSQVLKEMLHFTACHRLDSRLAVYVDSVADWNLLKDLAEQPRTLQHLCRLRVRRCFTARQLLNDDVILSLPLPNPLLNYLLFSQE